MQAEDSPMATGIAEVIGWPLTFYLLFDLPPAGRRVFSMERLATYG